MEMVFYFYYIPADQSIILTDPDELLSVAVLKAFKKARIKDMPVENISCFCQGPYSRYFLDINSKINDQRIQDPYGRKTNEMFSMENQAVYIIPTAYKSTLTNPGNPYDR